MKDNHFNFLRWAPLVASVALVLLIVFISTDAFKELKEATYWRHNTFEAILETQTAEDNLIDAQRRVHGYVTAGSTKMLVEYRNDTNAELQEISRLTEVNQGDPKKQEQLKALNAAVQAVFDYDDRIIGLYARQGKDAAQQMEKSGEGVDILDSAIADLENFKKDEKQLLEQRDSLEQADYRRAVRVLILSSLAAALLLFGSNFLVGREMARRRAAEKEQLELIEKLQKALAEVKTLSGLIPICGWCKNIRSDKGYWQSVETYVTKHTGAAFTHGMCPTCAAKWEAEAEAILAGNSNGASTNPTQ